MNREEFAKKLDELCKSHGVETYVFGGLYGKKEDERVIYKVQGNLMDALIVSAQLSGEVSGKCLIPE